jgi:hypothetical protein
MCASFLRECASPRDNFAGLFIGQFVLCLKRADEVRQTGVGFLSTAV